MVQGRVGMMTLMMTIEVRNKEGIKKMEIRIRERDFATH